MTRCSEKIDFPKSFQKCSEMVGGLEKRLEKLFRSPESLHWRPDWPVAARRRAKVGTSAMVEKSGLLR